MCLFTKNFQINTRKSNYCKVYNELYARKEYSRIFAKSEELLSGKDVVDSPCEGIATRLSGSLLLKCCHFKNPCPLALRDANLSSAPCSFWCLRPCPSYPPRRKPFQ